MDNFIELIFTGSYILEKKLIIKHTITSNELSLIIDKYNNYEGIEEVEIYTLKIVEGVKENWPYNIKKITIINIYPYELLSYKQFEESKMANHIVNYFAIPEGIEFVFSDSILRQLERVSEVDYTYKEYLSSMFSDKKIKYIKNLNKL